MDPLVKEYLKSHTFQQLEDDHGVCARLSSDGTKVSLNYDQLLVKDGDRLAEQCRGMVIRPTEWPRIASTGEGWKDQTVGDVSVLGWPMDRFYNLGDTNGADVDWSDPRLRVNEKLDGTMMVLYWDPLHIKWCAATRSVPDADLPIHKDHMEIGDMTFADLFWKANYETWLAAIHPIVQSFENFRTDCEASYDRRLTYVFELTSQWNRVVVKYDVPRVTLLAIRNTDTGRELDPLTNGQAYMPVPQSWSLRDPDALVAFLDGADPAKLEGAVVIDGRFRRTKVKNKAWVLSSKAKDLVTVSRRSALEAIIMERIDDVIPLLEKDVADELLRMKDALVGYCRSIDDRFARFRDSAAGSRKEFAGYVVSSGDWTPAYFQLWEKKSPNALAWVRATCGRGRLSTGSLDVLLGKLGPVPDVTVEVRQR